MEKKLKLIEYERHLKKIIEMQSMMEFEEIIYLVKKYIYHTEYGLAALELRDFFMYSENEIPEDVEKSLKNLFHFMEMDYNKEYPF